jgi:hypothetical protein
MLGQGSEYHKIDFIAKYLVTSLFQAIILNKINLPFYITYYRWRVYIVIVLLNMLFDFLKLESKNCRRENLKQVDYK